MLGEAKELYKNGNYQAVQADGVEAKAGKFGVEAQADELIAQIALAEQGGALSLYEAALAALRSGDNGRARALLTEVAAAGDSLDDSMRAKVENLLQKLSTDEKGKPDGKSGTHAAQDAEALAAQKLNAEVGTKIAEGRRLHETDPDKAIAIYEKTVQAVQAAGLSPDLTRPMVRRLEVAIELAKKDKVAFEVKMQDKQLRAEIEMKRLRILEADKAKKVRMKDLMDKAHHRLCRGQLRRVRGLRQAGHGGRSQRAGRLDAGLQGQDGTAVQARPPEQERQGRGRRHGRSREWTWRRSPIRKSRCGTSSSPRTSRT